jgi:hypothetical protein
MLRMSAMDSSMNIPRVRNAPLLRSILLLASGISVIRVRKTDRADCCNGNVRM